MRLLVAALCMGTIVLSGCGGSSSSGGDSSSESKEVTFFLAQSMNETEIMAPSRENTLGLYITDGSQDGTRLLKKVVVALGPKKLGDNWLIPVGWWNEEEAPVSALAVTDGTAQGTKTIGEVIEGDMPYGLTSFNGKIYFSQENNENGRELWVTDGTENGTRLFKDLVPGTHYGSPENLTVVGRKLYFNAYSSDESNLRVLWESDGTEEGTRQVSPTVYYPTNLTAFGNKLALGGSMLSGPLAYNISLVPTPPMDIEPLILDPESGVVSRIEDLWTGPSSSSPQLYTVADTLLIKANSDAYGNERLWFSKGESGDPDMVDVPTSAFAIIYTTSNGFYGVNRSSPDETYAALWRLNGADDVVKISMDNNLDYLPRYLTDLNGTAYLQAMDAMEDRELYRVEGNDLKLVADINPAGSSYPSGLTKVNDVLIFTATDEEHGRELWRTDGTEAGTQLLMDISPGTSSSDIVLNISDESLLHR
ncbi:hypothetical protein BTA51_23780 [Hahella sp. CCB-MM4]|uniref:ELWxxDGT repeat protein n=1 Tax=Hahella sp. (strain CCB-MM4) TaxID=1926491 RepID=UPI000B9A6D9F|nr:ELWxxDGT repeat protein [Hahella sp. CCB-MM4]OZG70861.1 hypothetical protein BTA51_23780 [Hahella sp. CCB-MM4]